MATHVRFLNRRQRRVRSVAGLIWIVLWMVPLLAPALAVRQGQGSATLPSGLGFTAFVLLYLPATWAAVEFRGRPGLRAAGPAGGGAPRGAPARRGPGAPRGWL